MAKDKGTPTKNNKNTPTKNKVKSPSKRDKNGLLQPKITSFFMNPSTDGEPNTKRNLAFERKPNKLLPGYFQPQSSTASSSTSGSSSNIKVEYDTDDSEVEILPTPVKPPPIVVTISESEGDSQELNLDDNDDKKKETDANKENKDKEIEKNKRMEVDLDLEIIGEFNFSRPAPNLPSTSTSSASASASTNLFSSKSISSDTDNDNIIITATITAPPKPKEKEVTRKSSRLTTNANSTTNKTLPQKLNEMETQLIDEHLDSGENDVNKSMNDSFEDENETDDEFVPSNSKDSMDLEENSTCSSSMTTPPNTPPKKQSFKSPTKSPKKNLTYFSPTRQMIIRTKSDSNISHHRRELFPQVETTTIDAPAKFKYFDLEDFLSVLNLVISDQLNAHLFDENDMNMVTGFIDNLSVQAQALYVKLFGRKWCYKMVKDYSYPNIHNTDLLPFFEELYSKGFVVSLKDEDLPLEEILDILKEDQLNGLVKRMNLKITSRNKDHQKAALLKLTTTQKTLRGDSKEILIRNAKNILGPTYKISERSRSLFTRVNIINAPPQYYDDEQSVQSNTKANFYLVNTGQIVYPSYEIYKTKPIYENRQELLDFHEAWGLHTLIQVHLENKKFDEILKIVDQVLDKVKILLENEEVKSRDEKLPEYLRVYKCTSIYIKILWMCVDALQKSKEYGKSNVIIMDLLLKQNIYCPRYRGRWYERVIINYRHLKVSDSEIRDIIVKALNDSISDNYKYDFALRKKKIDDMISKKKKVVVKPKSKKKKRKRLNKNSNGTKGKNNSEESSSASEDEDEESLDSGFDVGEPTEDITELNLNVEIPSITIEGEKMENYGQMGKSVFLGSGNENGTASSVEYFAMGYYKTVGYTFGLHGEGSVPATLYGLIFWDIIYSDKIPNVFFSKFQPFPLDFHFPDFYENRKQLIEDRLVLIRSGCGQEVILDLMNEIWTSNLNRLSIVNWSLFSSFEDIASLVKSIGHLVLGKICEKFAKNYRFSHKGFPDLVVWNGTKCIFSEIKGPNDKLSSNQIVWLNELNQMGANAEVCLVKAVSNKRIRLSH